MLKNILIKKMAKSLVIGGGIALLMLGCGGSDDSSGDIDPNVANNPVYSTSLTMSSSSLSFNSDDSFDITYEKNHDANASVYFIKQCNGESYSEQFIDNQRVENELFQDSSAFTGTMVISCNINRTSGNLVRYGCTNTYNSHIGEFILRNDNGCTFTVTESFDEVGESGNLFRLIYDQKIPGT